MEQRRFPRVEVLGRVRGFLDSLDSPLVVREMSLGGLSIETAFPLEVGSVHELRLAVGESAWVRLRAEVRHCRKTSAPGTSPRFVTGVQFVDAAGAQGASVADLIDTIKSS